MKMKNILKLIISAALCAAAAGTVSAQYLRTAYFMDKSAERYGFNPALAPERGFVTIPFLGSTHVSYTSNSLALSDIFYPKDGKLVTFLDQSVDAGKFLAGLRSNNQMNVDTRYDLVQAGWWKRDAFWSVGIGIRVNASLGIPKSLFEFMKDGNGYDGRIYDITGLRMKADAYADISIGYTRELDRRWTVGGKVKFLPGLGNMDMRFKSLHARMNDEVWQIDSQGELYSSVAGLQMKSKLDDHDREYVNGFKYDSFGLSGFGAAVDLGASYKLDDNWTFSASVLDLGFISWNKSSTRYALADGEFEYDGFELPLGTNDLPTISDQFDAMKDDLENLFHFTEQSYGSGRSTMLVATLSAGAEYALTGNKISFGLLSTTRFYRPKAYTEVTLSANFRPVYWFSGSLSYSALHSAFRTYGIALNFNPNGFHFFVGSDYMITRVNQQFIPVDARAENIYLGMSIPLRYRNRTGARR